MEPLWRLSDRLVAGGFIRPAVLIRGLQPHRPSLSRWPVILTLSLSGLAVQPIAWLHDGDGKSRLLIKPFPRTRFLLLQWSPIDSIRSLIRVQPCLGELVSLQPPSLRRQVGETGAARAELMQGLEMSCSDLLTRPLETVKRIQDDFGISSWSEVEGPILQRIAKARADKADPVHLRDCLKTA